MSNLSKSQRKELLRTREHEAQVAAELQRERRVGEDVSWRGVGERVLHIREISSFSGGSIWDVRRIGGELLLYVSELNPEKSGYLHPGYRRLDADPQRLTNILTDLVAAKVVSWLPADSQAGLDGTTTTVEFQSGSAAAAFSWWQDGPLEWGEFTRAIRQVVREFKLLSNSSIERASPGEPVVASHVK